MVVDKDLEDAASESSANSFTTADPLGKTAMPGEDFDNVRETVLWPGHTYIIFERSSGRVITLSNGSLCLQDLDDGEHISNRWLCVEKNGYFSLHDPKSGKYLGHDGKNNMCASATEFREWESITPRAHPNGGYQLLVPHWWHSLRTIVVTEDGNSLVTRSHGETSWTFLKVSG